MSQRGSKTENNRPYLKKEVYNWNVLVVTAYYNKILYSVCAAPMVTWALKERQTTGLASTNEM